VGHIRSRSWLADPAQTVQGVQRRGPTRKLRLPQPSQQSSPEYSSACSGVHSPDTAVELLIRARGGTFLDAGQSWLRTDDRGITCLDPQVIDRYSCSVLGERSRTWKAIRRCRQPSSQPGLRPSRSRPVVNADAIDADTDRRDPTSTGGGSVRKPAVSNGASTAHGTACRYVFQEVAALQPQKREMRRQLVEDDIHDQVRITKSPVSRHRRPRTR
jgi:hypothetical protein